MPTVYTFSLKPEKTIYLNYNIEKFLNSVLALFLAALKTKSGDLRCSVQSFFMT